MTPNGPFGEEQIKQLRNSLPVPEYRVMEKMMPRLSNIVDEARQRGLTRSTFYLGLGIPNLPIRAKFSDRSGNSMMRNLSLRRIWEEEAGTPYTLLDAVRMESAITRLIQGLDGFTDTRY